MLLMKNSHWDRDTIFLSYCSLYLFVSYAMIHPAVCSELNRVLMVIRSLSRLLSPTSQLRILGNEQRFVNVITQERGNAKVLPIPNITKSNGLDSSLSLGQLKSFRWRSGNKRGNLCQRRQQKGSLNLPRIWPRTPPKPVKPREESSSIESRWEREVKHLVGSFQSSLTDTYTSDLLNLQLRLL